MNEGGPARIRDRTAQLLAHGIGVEQELELASAGREAARDDHARAAFRGDLHDADAVGTDVFADGVREYRQNLAQCCGIGDKAGESHEDIDGAVSVHRSPVVM